MVVTNCHVAGIFGQKKGERFVFRTAPGLAEPMAARVDFLQEADNPARREFNVVEILYIEPDGGVDLALLRLAPAPGDSRPARPIPLAAAAPARGQFVASVGYPARDSRVPDQALVLRLFGDVYDKKRLAPGALLGARQGLVTHDCSTLGGNSGSVLLDLQTGEAVGLHFAGLYLQENYAVPAALIRDRIERFCRRVTTPVPFGPPPKSEPADLPPTLGPPADALPSSPGATVAPAGLSITWTIPLCLTVQLGTPTMTAIPGQLAAAAAATPTAPAHGEAERIGAAVSEARRQLWGRDDVLGVRPGYRFRNGWITDERAVVVLVRRKLDPEALRAEQIEPLPAEFLGVPVEHHAGLALRPALARPRGGGGRAGSACPKHTTSPPGTRSSRRWTRR